MTIGMLHCITVSGTARRGRDPAAISKYTKPGMLRQAGGTLGRDAPGVLALRPQIGRGGVFAVVGMVQGDGRTCADGPTGVCHLAFRRA